MKSMPGNVNIFHLIIRYFDALWIFIEPIAMFENNCK